MKVTYIDYQQLLTECKQDQAIAVDIRSTDAYNENHIEGSRSIPFFSLRMSLKELSKEAKKIIIICEEGRVSKAAAFVLIKNGIDAEILKKGMQGVPKEPEGAGKAIFSIDETETEDVIAREEQDPSDNEQSEKAIEVNASGGNGDSNLEQENQSLKAENKRLTMELEQVKKQYKALYTQTEKLKTAYDMLKSSK